MTSRTEQRRDTAAERVEDAMGDLEELERTLADEIAEIEGRWASAAADIDDVRIGLETTDITVSQLALVWVLRG